MDNLNFRACQYLSDYRLLQISCKSKVIPYLEDDNQIEFGEYSIFSDDEEEDEDYKEFEKEQQEKKLIKQLKKEQKKKIKENKRKNGRAKK